MYSEPGTLVWEQAIARTLRDPSSIQLYRQPIIDLARGLTAGFELLARFASTGLQASPDRWFAAAYRLGLGPQLEAIVLRQALALRAEAPPNTFLTVNLDPAALAHEEVAAVLLGEHDLTRLVVEITEHTEVHDADHLNRLLAEVRQRGAFIAVDDTGTGYSNFQRLLTVRPQFVKLDQAFVRGMDHDPVKRTLVEMVGQFAARIDAWVIAEGIETEGELRELVRMGVPLGQGYLLNRPAPGFEPLSVGVRQAIAAVQPSEDPDAATIASVLEPVALLPLTSSEADGSSATAVLVDHHSRPAPVVHQERRFPALCVTPSCALADVAPRAMARPADERFAPLVVVDDLGRPVGIARLERIVEALARLAAASPA
ncbi:EAL domain-containing protein [Tepidiforma sp.]|uniref:EAL domain-containing protein n=1 Tax=Tepidiforma sp. TaxID=2682230 RepID=UPI002ADDE664|nr:EAL domain-containing protein [Tepidiforma sp.]